jgi:hypothetical protein
METRMPPPSGRYGPPTTPPSTPSPPPGGPGRLLTRFPVVLGGAAGVALAAVALVLVLLIHPAPAPAQPPDAAARAICASLRAQNYTALYAELTPHLRGLGTQDQFIASQRQIDSAQGVVTACAFSVGHVDASSADIAFHITRTRAGTLTGQTGFVFDGSTWQLDTYDTSVL